MVKISNISKSFGEKKVLDDFSLDIPEHGVICLMGKSGSGKTTLLNILMSLISADSGSVDIPDNLRIAAVFQDDRLIENYTAIQNVMFVIKSRAKNEKLHAAQDALALLNALGLEDASEKKASELSGGMRRRVAIARALAIKPQLLILDEPFKGLDTETKATVMNEILSYSITGSVLIVTHDIADADFFHVLPISLDT